MGIFGWLKPEEEPEDRTIGEISNDDGDHAVFEIPAEDEGKMRRLMRENKVERDRDDELNKSRAGQRQMERRDSQKSRYDMEKVVDKKEDLEDPHDRENDTSDEERSEQPASWWNPFS